jgi:hypothetical protein
MIPQEKSAAVTRGLCEAFGVTAFEDIQADPRPQFGSRLSIVVRRRPFLLRIITRTDDPTRQFHMHEAGCRSRSCTGVWTPA